jgi:O-acetyl-ADP-ribose deacetylase (regulator of RNase III)
MEALEDEATEDQRVTETHRFGGTVLLATVGRLTDQPVHGLALAANQRGVMAAGVAGSVRGLAGDRVEREAMARAPLPLGSAIRTGAGGLEERGVMALFNAVVTVAPGEPARMSDIRRAITDVLRLADEARIRSLALPAIGSGAAVGQLPFPKVAAEIIEAIVAYLRRTTSRIERIVFVTSLEEDQALVNALIRVAYEHQWADLE